MSFIVDIKRSIIAAPGPIAIEAALYITAGPGNGYPQFVVAGRSGYERVFRILPADRNYPRTHQFVLFLGFIAEIVTALGKQRPVFMFDHLYPCGGSIQHPFVAIQGNEGEFDGLVQREPGIAVVGHTEKMGLGEDIDGSAAADGTAGLVEDRRIEM